MNKTEDELWLVKIKPSHLFNDPELRELYHPHDRVVVLPETLSVETPRRELLPIVLIKVRPVKNPEAIMAISLDKLVLTKSQRKFFSKTNQLPPAYFKRISSVIDRQEQSISGCYLIEDGDEAEELVCCGVNPLVDNFNND